jgi:hypothetical protein
MKVWARVNHVGWVHFWRREADYLNGEPSAHFLNGRTDPRWQETALNPEQRRGLEAGDLVELEDPGFFQDED